MSERNRTLRLSPAEAARLAGRCVGKADLADRPLAPGMLAVGDAVDLLAHVPDASVDLVFADPPYNLDKRFGTHAGRAMSLDAYEAWVRTWIEPLRRVLKPHGSLYVCGDWRSSTALHRVLDQHFVVRNRITWEREKGRGARSNWKNASEDVWFATVGDEYTFDADAVRVRRRVVAPYRDSAGAPKDWQEKSGLRYRDTAPSNLWTDLTVPFWSMPENTEHPTQKPEKLLAKVILASSRPGDVVLDPFAGSGTTLAVAEKLGRRWIGIEIDRDHACVALRRLELASVEPRIQGYADSVFWERNSRPSASDPTEIDHERAPAE